MPTHLGGLHDRVKQEPSRFSKPQQASLDENGVMEGGTRNGGGGGAWDEDAMVIDAFQLLCAYSSSEFLTCVILFLVVMPL
jgi:hypothetical protein